MKAPKDVSSAVQTMVENWPLQHEGTERMRRARIRARAISLRPKVEATARKTPPCQAHSAHGDGQYPRGRQDPRRKHVLQPVEVRAEKQGDGALRTCYRFDPNGGYLAAGTMQRTGGDGEAEGGKLVLFYVRRWAITLSAVTDHRYYVQLDTGLECAKAGQN